MKQQQYTYNDPSATLAAFGIARPAGLDEANAAANAVRLLANEGVEHVHPGNTTAETVEADIAAAVARRDIRDYARDLTQNFDRHARNLSRELYRDDSERIIKELTAATKPRLKAITEAAKVLRPHDNAETVIERGQAAVDAWRNREKIDTAHAELMRIANTVEMLAVLSGRMRQLVPDPLWWIDVTDHNDLARIEANEWSDYDSRFLALIQAGRTVVLATPEQATARAEAVQQSSETEASKPFRDRLAAHNAREQRKAERMLAMQERLVVRE